MNEKAPKESKFKHTRELVRIALNEGMTQSDIARVCRTQQSVVSHWADGSSKARQSQVAPLIQRFGHKLNRSTSRVYYVEDPPDPEVRWEDTERAQKLLQLKSIEPQSCDDPEFRTALGTLGRELYPWPYPEPDTKSLDVDTLIRRDRENFNPAKWRLIVVEGPVVFRHTFTFPMERARGKQIQLVFEPFRRVIVHLHEPNQLVGVWQWRRSLDELGIDSWQQFTIRHEPGRNGPWVVAHDDAARWNSAIKSAKSLPEFIADFDTTIGSGAQRFGPDDRATAPFLLRKALIERGFDVPGVERIVPQL